MSNHQQILNEFMERHPHWNLQCNVEPLFAAAARPLSIANLEAAAERIQLAMAPEFTNALGEFFAKYPQYKCESNVSVLLKLWSGQFITASALEEVAGRTPCPLTVNAAYTAAAQNERYRAQLIQTITQGRSQFGLFSKAHGATRYYDSASLEQETTETLQQYADEITSRVRFEGQSAQELRQQLRAQEQQQQSAAPAFVLINEKTGREFTRTELVNADRATYRKLLFTKDGISKPNAKQVSAEITRILRGV